LLVAGGNNNNNNNNNNNKDNNNNKWWQLGCIYTKGLYCNSTHPTTLTFCLQPIQLIILYEVTSVVPITAAVSETISVS